MAASTAIIGLQVASSLMSGGGQMSQANAEAATLRENARLTELQGNNDAFAMMREQRMEDGAMAVANAGAGVGAGSGSIGDILYANARARWESALNITANAKAQGDAMRSQAKQIKKAGQAAMVGGIMQAGASVLGGMAKEDAYNKTQAAISKNRKIQLQGPARTSLYGASFRPVGR